MAPREPRPSAGRDPGPHRIVIDALAARFGGTAYAAIRLAQGLADRDDVEIVVVVTRRGSIVDAGLQPNAQLRRVRLARGAWAELPRRLAWEALGLPRVLAEERASAMVTFSGMLPRRVDVPVLSYLLNPVALVDRGVGNSIRRLLIERTSNWAAASISPTEAMASMVQEALGVPSHVVSLGIDHESFAPVAVPGEDLLCVADFYRHKRHDLLLAAWAHITAPRPRLVLVGNPAVDLAWYDEVRQQADTLSSSGEIEFLSDLSLSALVRRYQRARLLVLPSERESFCIPVLEAAAVGVPAVLTDCSVLRETAGDGAVYVADKDPAVWADAIGPLMVDEVRHARLRQAAVSHSWGYSWDRMVDQVLALADEVVSRPRAVPNRWPRWPASLALLGLLVAAVIATVAASQSADPLRSDGRAPRPVVAKTSSNPVSPDPTVYGFGVDRVVPSGIPTLTGPVDKGWHLLQHGRVGRIGLHPTGRRGPYYTFGMAVEARQRARLDVLTELGERASATFAGPAILNFGPFRTPRQTGGLLGIALNSASVSSSAAGPAIKLSPIDAKYLQPGEAIVRPDDLRQTGPGGLPGIVVGPGLTARFRVAPGTHGPVQAVLTTESLEGSGSVGVKVGATTLDLAVGSRPTTHASQSFAASGAVVSVSVPRSFRGGLIIGSLRLVQVRP